MEELAESCPGSSIKMRGRRRGRARRQKTVREKGDGDLGEETDCERIPIKNILVYCNYHKYHSERFSWQSISSNSLNRCTYLRGKVP